MLVLLVKEADRTRRARLPEAGRLVVGRGGSCDIRLSDPSLAPEHLAIEATPAGLKITDLGGEAGTHVNGHRVSQALLKVGDVIAAGAVRMRIGRVKPPASPPAPKTPGRPVPATRPPRRRRRGGAIWAILGVLLLAAGAVAFLLSRESAEEREAELAWAEAQSACERGETDRAKEGFRAVLERWPGTEQAARARKGLEEIEARARREADAAADREALVARIPALTFEEFEAEWKQLEREFAGTAAFADRAPLDAARETYRKAAAERLEAARRRAGDLLETARYADAILVWHEYLSFPTNVPPDRKAAAEAVRAIQERASRDFKAIAAEAEKLLAKKRYAEARSLLRGHLTEFRGTRYSLDLRQKLDRVGVLDRSRAAEPAAAEAVSVKRDEFLRAAEKAESLAHVRRYAEAADLYSKTAVRTPFKDLAAEFRSRAGELEEYAFLLAELRTQISRLPDRFQQIDLGIRATAVGADDDYLYIQVRGAESKLAWARMGDDRVLALLERLKLDPPGRLKLARFAFECGEDAAAHGAISKALAADPSLREKAFLLLARSRGLPDVPPGGFVEHKSRWLTPAERDREVLLDRIRAAEAQASSRDIRRSDEGLARLRELGGPAEAALARALAVQRKVTLDALASLPVLRDPATVASLYRELEARRKAALELIFDTKKYPYPYGPNQKEVQAEVDGLVDKVREVWENPISLLLEKNEEVRRLSERAEAVSKELAGLGRKPETSLADLVKEVNERIGLKRYVPGSREKSALEWNDRVLEYNRVVDVGADEQEKACLLATNLYRMMMGRRAVMMNGKLLQCARAHSKDMKENHYFAHDCPIPGHEEHRTPSQRARLAGYGGGVSENIARGSEDGVQTFRQWYHSSGHHRNLLGKNHTEVGIGRDGDFWTENFGSRKKTVDLPGEKKGRGK